MISLGVLKKLANVSLRFKGFQDKITLWHIYLKVENNKYPTNMILRSSKARIKGQIINLQVKMQQAVYV